MNESNFKEFKKIFSSGQSLYKFVVENVFDGIYIIENEKFVFANKAFHEMLDYNDQEVITSELHIWDLIHQLSIKDIKRRTSHSIKNEYIPSRYEFYAKKKHGEALLVEVNVTYLEENKKVVLGIVRDISLRKNYDYVEIENFIHHWNGSFNDLLKEVVFRLEKICNFTHGGAFLYSGGKITTIDFYPKKKTHANLSFIPIELSRKILKNVLLGEVEYLDTVSSLDYNSKESIVLFDGLILPIIFNSYVVGGIYFAEKYDYSFGVQKKEFYKYVVDLLASKYSEIENQNIIKKSELEAEYANIRLQTSNFKTEKLLQDLKHETITPINAIMGHLSLILERWNIVANDYKREKIQTTLKEVIRLRDIYKDIEYLTMINVPVKLEEVLLIEDIIWPAVSLFDEALREKNIKMLVESKNIFPKLHLDKSKFELVVSNLLGNVVKYSYKSTVATIRASSGDLHYFYLDFENEGVGIPEDEKEKIFLEKYRATNVSRQSSGIEGSGLGLFFVKTFLSSINCDIKVEKCKNPTIFRIYIPKK